MCLVDQMGVEPITPTLQRLVASNGMLARSFLTSGRHGIRTHIPVGGTRISSAVRRTVSGYLP